ncbi:MAG: efflux RND transporter periplasmic adaptor subunit [Arcobacteraceae bacterium]
MRKLTKKVSVFVVTAIAVPTFLLGAGAPTASEMPAPKADIYIVQKAADLNINLQYPAQIKSFQDVEVYARVQGVLEEKLFTEGNKVSKGDLLFKIEDDIYQAKVDAAIASEKMARSTLNNATRSWDRIKKLYKSKAVSVESRDTALSTYENALASLSMAKAQLTQAQIDLGYTNVKAPISGIAGVKKVDIGNLVKNDGNSALVRIVQNDKVFIDFSMPLSDFKNIQSGLWSMPKDNKIGVSVTLNGKTTQETGVVDFIDAVIDQKTSTVKMRAIVDNPIQTLVPGNFIRVTLTGIVQKDVITFPQKALLQNPMGTIVFVEKDGVASVKPVKIGKESGNNYVSAGGPLQSGDRVIVNNFFRVKPGQPVQVDKIINQ